jgi:glyoxylase-like metal-dependent hydrolase (beta-lactamase superfamily II)
MRSGSGAIGLAMIVLGVNAFAGCSRAIEPLTSPGRSAVALTGGPNTSMVFVARTAGGVLAVDLGWWGSEDALVRALHDLGAAPGEVDAVFLTHSHRDHIGAWRSVRRARFHVAEPELSRFVGDTAHRGWIPALVNRVMHSDRPRPGELDVRTFSRDTFFVLGSDTLRAYLVPGHTAGSAVYLFRGVLFLGDAATYSRLGGFGPAKPGFSDDASRAAESLERLWPRLPEDRVRYICTAHARCTSFAGDFLRDVEDPVR